MAYSDVVLADSPGIYWRLNETSGTTAADSSGNSATGTYNSMVLGQTGLIAGDTDKSAKFPTPSNNGWINRAAGTLQTTQFTAECWYASSSGGTLLEFMNPFTSSQSVWRLVISGATIIVSIIDTTGTTQTFTATNIPTPANAFSVAHLALTHNSGAVKLYQNGIIIIDSTLTSGTSIRTGTSAYFSAGQFQSINGYPAGAFIDEVAWYPSALSATRINAHYSAGAVTGTATLTGAGTLGIRPELFITNSGVGFLSLTNQRLASAASISTAGIGLLSFTAQQPTSIVSTPLAGSGSLAVNGVGASINVVNYSGAGVLEAVGEVTGGNNTGGGSDNSSTNTQDLSKSPSYLSTYRYYVTDTTDDQLIAELQLNDVSFSSKVSAAGEFSAQIPMAADNQGLDLFWATVPGKRAVHVMRGDQAVWGGLIWSRDYDVVNRTISIQGASWESILFKRNIWHTLVYPNTMDQYDVVRDLIKQMNTDFQGVDAAADNVVQAQTNSDTGIEVVSGLSGKFQDTQTYLGSELKSFGEAMTELGNNLGGFEWNINVVWDPGTQAFRRILVFRDTPPAQLPSSQTYTGSRPGLDSNIFEFPGNIMTLSLGESVDEASTRYFVVGGAPAGVEGSEAAKPRASWNNADFLSDGWPLLESVESSKHSDVSKKSTLRGYARVYGQRTKPPIPTWTVTVNGSSDPVVGSYEPGDWCRIVTPHDTFVQNKLRSNQSNSSDSPTQDGFIKRIMGYSVSIPTNPQFPESVTLELVDEWISASGELSGSDGITALDKPSAPINLTGAAGDQRVRLDWDSNPASQLVTKYTVYRGTNKSDPLGETTKSQLVVTGLTNKTEYTLTVRATNLEGDSEASQSIVLTPTAPTTSTGGGGGSTPAPNVNNSLRITAVNTNWKTGYNKEIIQNCCEFSDVLLVQEAKDYMMDDVLPKGWVGYQDTGGRTRDNDPQNPGRAGTVVCIRKSKTDYVDDGLFFCVDPDGIPARYIKWVTIKDLAGNKIRLASAHWPTATIGSQGTMNNKVKDFIDGIPSTQAIVFGADTNQVYDDVARLLGLNADGVGRMLIGSKRGSATNYKKRTLRGSDHPVITITFKATD